MEFLILLSKGAEFIWYLQKYENIGMLLFTYSLFSQATAKSKAGGLITGSFV